MIKQILKKLPLLISLSILFFITLFIYKNITKINISEVNLNFRFFGGAVFFLWLWLGFSFFRFHLIIKKSFIDISISKTLKVWSKAYFALYIPGKIGLPAYRALLFQKQGFSANKVFFAYFIETILSIITSIIVISIAGLFYNSDLIAPYKNYMLLLLFISIVAVHPFFIKKYYSFYCNFRNIDFDSNYVVFNYLFYLKVIGIQLISSLFQGFGFFLFINSVVFVSFSHFPYIIALYFFATISGLLAFFTAGGIGVVESILLLGLKSFLSPFFAGLLSILVRLWKFLGEITFILLLRMILKRFLWNKEDNAA